MGGLIAKQVNELNVQMHWISFFWLTWTIGSSSADPQFRHIINLNNVKGVVFFGTPHRGAEMAKMATSIDCVIRGTQLGNRRKYIKGRAPSKISVYVLKSQIGLGTNRYFRHHHTNLFVLSFYEECLSQVGLSTRIGDSSMWPLFISR